MVTKLPFQPSSDAGQAPSHLPPVEDKQTVGKRPKAASNLKAEEPGNEKFLQRAHKISQDFLQTSGHVAECQEVDIQYWSLDLPRGHQL